MQLLCESISPKKMLSFMPKWKAGGMKSVSNGVVECCEVLLCLCPGCCIPGLWGKTWIICDWIQALIIALQNPVSSRTAEKPRALKPYCQVPIKKVSLKETGQITSYFTICPFNREPDLAASMNRWIVCFWSRWNTCVLHLSWQGPCLLAGSHVNSPEHVVAMAAHWVTQ